MSDPSVEAALGATIAAAQTRLEGLLVERGRLRALLEVGGDSDPDTTRGLRDSLNRLDHQIGQILASWQQAGGQVLLTPGGAPVRSATAPPRAQPPVTTRSRRVLTPEPGPRVDTTWREAFGQLMANLGPGTDLAGEIDIVIEAAVSCDQWSRWPRHVQRHLVGLLACRLRSLQDEQGVPEYELQDGFSALTRFSKRVKPGFVFGLSRSHRPQHGASWDDDAVRHWDQLAALLPEDHELTDEQEELVDQLTFLIDDLGDAPSDDAREAVRSQAIRLLAETLEAGVDAREPALVALAMALQPLPNSRVFLRLRAALRDAAAPPVDHADGLDIPPDWGWWAHTRDKTGLILGGEPNEHTRETLQRSLGMSGLYWTDLQAGRRLLAAGRVDVLIVLEPRLSDDMMAEALPLASANEVPLVHVDHGSSVARVKSAIERFIEREGAARL